ncbi:hypothetical protein chiPu_0019688, partial [Chiloscyllium punctatum]|nr:hypothetical protein [Chiloscyllium punctatum]
RGLTVQLCDAKELTAQSTPLLPLSKPSDTTVLHSADPAIAVRIVPLAQGSELAKPMLEGTEVRHKKTSQLNSQSGQSLNCLCMSDLMYRQEFAIVHLTPPRIEVEGIS